ncbi:UNVERIFIED_ORG: hypothetical protein J2W38_001608 [Variovorax paradoxus]|nr:hypothetical protein [Variovorax paradoxus]
MICAQPWCEHNHSAPWPGVALPDRAAHLAGISAVVQPISVGIRPLPLRAVARHGYNQVALGWAQGVCSTLSVLLMAVVGYEAGTTSASDSSMCLVTKLFKLIGNTLAKVRDS